MHSLYTEFSGGGLSLVPFFYENDKYGFTQRARQGSRHPKNCILQYEHYSVLLNLETTVGRATTLISVKFSYILQEILFYTLIFTKLSHQFIYSIHLFNKIIISFNIVISQHNPHSHCHQATTIINLASSLPLSNKIDTGIQQKKNQKTQPKEQIGNLPTHTHNHRYHQPTPTSLSRQPQVQPKNQKKKKKKKKKQISDQERTSNRDLKELIWSTIDQRRGLSRWHGLARVR